MHLISQADSTVQTNPYINFSRSRKGKTIEQAKALTKEDFFHAIGSEGETVAEKVEGIIELLNRGIKRFEARTI